MFKVTMLCQVFFLTVEVVFFSQSNPVKAEPLKIHYSQGNSSFDNRSNYFIQVLQLAMNKSTKRLGDYLLIPIAAPTTQARRFQSVRRQGGLDITWGMSSPERENEFIAIPFPLLKGLIGYRVLLIHKDSQDAFRRLEHQDDFQKMKAIQGTSWPDVEYLTHNDFQVVTHSGYEVLFNMLRKKRVDYFPRSIEEVWSELEGPYAKDILLLDNVLLHYQAPIYFFVSKENPELAERILSGLEIANRDGSFQQLFDQHPSVIKAKAFLNKPDLKVFKLNAPYNLPSLPGMNSDYWYYPDVMTITE